MKIKKINLLNPETEIIAQAVKVLHEGKLVVHPTETCYGFAADVLNQNALEDLYAAKGRDFNKPVSMMVRSIEEAQKYVEFNEVALRLAERFWPGPVTLVLPRKAALPVFFNRAQSTLGVRCPDSAIARALIDGFGGPLTTTSANLSGEPEAYNVQDFLNQYDKFEKGLEKLGMILDGGELISKSQDDVLSKNPPSTVVGFDNKGNPVILREGALLDVVRKFLEKSA